MKNQPMKIIKVINYSPKLQNYIVQFKISGSRLFFGFFAVYHNYIWRCQFLQHPAVLIYFTDTAVGMSYNLHGKGNYCNYKV